MCFDWNKTKRRSRKTWAVFTCWLPWASLTFTVGISKVFIYQKQEIVTQQKGSGLCISCLHLCMCVCIYVIRGEKRQAGGPGEDANSCIPQSGAPKLVFIREAAWELQPANVCIRLACLDGKKISICLCKYQGEHEEEIPRHTYIRKTACQRYEASKKESDNLGIYVLRNDTSTKQLKHDRNLVQAGSQARPG